MSCIVAAGIQHCSMLQCPDCRHLGLQIAGPVSNLQCNLQIATSRRGSLSDCTLIRGTDSLPAAAAQWALGMLLYQLLSGTLPFWEEGGSQSPFTVMTAILGGEVSFEGPAWQAISPHGASSPCYTTACLHPEGPHAVSHRCSHGLVAGFQAGASLW